MKLIDYDLFLFDFDGLLVNTEYFHYRAYQKMCSDRGFLLPWDFPKYIEAAHYSAEGLRDRIYAEFPQLQQQESDWSVLYQEKKEALLNLYFEEPIPLMPGVKELLAYLNALGKKLCVVTHSDGDLVALIRKKNEDLNIISNWITREDYQLPKPNPECYLKAIEIYGKKDERIIGFEDTPRGLQALMGTLATPVMVTQVNYPELKELKAKGVFHIGSFEELLL